MNKALALILGATSLTSPALAQHAGHTIAQPVIKSAPPASDPHAGHVMPSPTPPLVATDPHAGHVTAAPAAMAAPVPAPPVAPPPALALSGSAHAADAAFGQRAMSQARQQLRREHGGITTYKLLLDRVEAQVRDGQDGYAIDAEAWVGDDINRLWLKAEVEGAFHDIPEQAQVQALWSHAIDPWFNLQVGVRHDLRPDPERTHLVAGIHGLAPFWFEVDAAAFLSTQGDLTARLEVEYDQRLTQRLILQPSMELDLSAQDVPELGVGSGLTSAEVGLRLRYELVPEFAPYIGIAYERAFGDTARYRRLAGDSVGGWNLLLGVRAWF